MAKIRIWNIAHEMPGANLRNGELLIAVPPIGGFVEVEDKYKRAAERMVNNVVNERNQPKLSLREPRYGSVEQEAGVTVVDALQRKIAELEAQLAAKSEVVEVIDDAPLEDLSNADAEHAALQAEIAAETALLEKKRAGRPKKEDN